MKKLRNIFKSQDGAALVLVLFLTTVIAISTSALLFNSFYSSENSVYGERKLEATQLAKGGVEAGLAYIEVKLFENEEIENTEFSRDDWYDVEITVDNDEDTFSVQSAAIYQAVLGDRDVTYIVNGTFTEGSTGGGGTVIGGLESIFFDNAVVTAYAGSGGGHAHGQTTFEVVGSTLVTVNGNFLAKEKLDKWNGVPIAVDPEKVYDPLSASTFRNEYNRLRAQFGTLPSKLKGTENYPTYWPVGPTQDIFGVKELKEINISGGNGYTLTFKDDVYVKDLVINSGSFNVVFEGLVHAENITISGSSGGNIHFMNNVIVEKDFEMRSSGYDLTVDGIILTDRFIYRHNSNETYSVPYIVASKSIEIISNNSIMNTSGLAAPDIVVGGWSVDNFNINPTSGSTGGSGGTGATGSYTITDWNIE